MKFILIGLLQLFMFDMCGQTFNERLSFDSFSRDGGIFCFEAESKYVFFGSYYDTLGLIKSGSIVVDFNGVVLHQSIIYADSTLLFLGHYSGGSQFEDGFVACGSLNSPPYSNFSGQIVVFDNLGDTIWTRNIESIDGEDLLLYSALKIVDGYVVCGTSGQDDELTKGVLIKLDDEGEQVWRKEYLPQNGVGVSLVSLEVLPSGGFLLGGATTAAFNWNHLVIKTDSLGNQIWRKTEGDEFSNSFAMVANTADGKYIFAGEDQNAEQFHDRSQVTKLNTNGTVAWTHYYGEEGPDCWAASIKVMPDGGFVFCGSDRSFGGLYGYICRIDENGNQLWYRKYRQTEGNWGWFTDVAPTSDGGFILTGLLQSDSNLNLPQDMWAIKLDSMGCLIPGCQVGIIEKGEVAAMRIYPNPADDFINVFVESQQVGDCALHLYDLQGRELQCTTVRESGNTWMMDSATLSPGTYLLQLLVDGVVVKSEKVVVRH